MKDGERDPLSVGRGDLEEDVRGAAFGFGGAEEGASEKGTEEEECWAAVGGRGGMEAVEGAGEGGPPKGGRREE